MNYKSFPTEIYTQVYERLVGWLVYFWVFWHITLKVI